MDMRAQQFLPHENFSPEMASYTEGSHLHFIEEGGCPFTMQMPVTQQRLEAKPISLCIWYLKYS